MVFRSQLNYFPFWSIATIRLQALFFDAAIGPRRRFASFATQTYLTLACYAYGELLDDIASNRNGEFMYSEINCTAGTKW